MTKTEIHRWMYERRRQAGDLVNQRQLAIDKIESLASELKALVRNNPRDERIPARRELLRNVQEASDLWLNDINKVLAMEDAMLSYISRRIGITMPPIAAYIAGAPHLPK